MFTRRRFYRRLNEGKRKGGGEKKRGKIESAPEGEGGLTWEKKGKGGGRGGKYLSLPRRQGKKKERNVNRHFTAFCKEGGEKRLWRSVGHRKEGKGLMPTP